MARNDIHDFLHGLVSSEKIASSDLSHLSFDELEALMGAETEEEKVAYAMMCGPGDENWLQQFSYTELYDKAIALAEKELALEREELKQRLARKRTIIDDSLWNKRDQLRLEKDQLVLELHKKKAKDQKKGQKTAANGDPDRERKARMGLLKKANIPGSAGFPIKPGNFSPEFIKKLKDTFEAPVVRGGLKGVIKSSAKKISEVVEYTGQVNNGEPQAPEWPRAALGVDAAGRKATPEELKPQTMVRDPDAQHVEPHADGQDFVKKVSELVVKMAKEEKGMFGVKHPVTYGITHMIHRGDVGEARKSLKALKAQGGSKTDVETLKEYIANHSKKAADLTEAKRDDLGKKEFALPKQRKFPIHDEAHARNALARAAQFGSPAVQAKVRAAVAKKYPGIDLTSASKPEKPTVKASVTKTSAARRKGASFVTPEAVNALEKHLLAARSAVTKKPPPVPISTASRRGGVVIHQTTRPLTQAGEAARKARLATLEHMERGVSAGAM